MILPDSIDDTHIGSSFPRDAAAADVTEPWSTGIVTFGADDYLMFHTPMRPFGEQCGTGCRRIGQVGLISQTNMCGTGEYVYYGAGGVLRLHVPTGRVDWLTRSLAPSQTATVGCTPSGPVIILDDVTDDYFAAALVQLPGSSLTGTVIWQTGPAPQSLMQLAPATVSGSDTLLAFDPNSSGPDSVCGSRLRHLRRRGGCSERIRRRCRSCRAIGSSSVTVATSGPGMSATRISLI